MIAIPTACAMGYYLPPLSGPGASRGAFGMREILLTGRRGDV
jgi:hypothetical protein